MLVVGPMRIPTTIAWISALVVSGVSGSAAHAQEPHAQDDASADPQLSALDDAHAALAIETSGGDGDTAVGVRALASYDVLHGNQDRYRPAIGVGFTLGVTGRDVQMSTRGIYDVGAMVTASLRFHTPGVVVDRRVFASASLLSDFGPMTTTTGTRFSVGGNWFSAAAEAQNAWLLLLPQQVEAYYQEQLGDERYGLALAYGF